MSEQQPEQPTLTPQPNRILAEPATVETCTGDLRTPAEQTAAAGAANNQFAETRMAAADQAGAKGSRR